ncbi:Uncharacterised protein [uncultured Clostridium sp.]|nr:Uncharacterised protein [uncultured Clostridium sp.]
MELTHLEYLEEILNSKDACDHLTGYQKMVIDALTELLSYCPYERLCELAQADREGRCVVLEDITVSDLQQMLSILDSTCYGDGTETYTTGYRNGHRNGRIEILRHVLGIHEGTSEDTEAALRREQE